MLDSRVGLCDEWKSVFRPTASLHIKVAAKIGHRTLPFSKQCFTEFHDNWRDMDNFVRKRVARWHYLYIASVLYIRPG